MNVLLEKKPSSVQHHFFVHSFPLDFITPFMLMLQKVAVYIYLIEISLRDNLNALKQVANYLHFIWY